MRYWPLLILLLCTGCTSPQATPAPVVTRPALSGISFGHPFSEVWARLQAEGKQPRMTPDNQAIAYQDVWAYHPFLAVQHFTPHQKSSILEYWLQNGSSITDMQQCEQKFHYFRTVLTATYGTPDSGLTTEKINSGCDVSARYSFADSSFAELYYTFNPGPANSKEQAGCTVRLSYHPAWARLCLVTNNRFCDIGDNSMPLGIDE